MRISIISFGQSAASFSSNFKMSGSIQLFQFVRKFHQTIGIRLSQSNQNQKQSSIISARAIIFFICTAQLILTTVAYLVFEAKSMLEFGFTFYMVITEVNCVVIYAIFIWQSKNTSKFIENCEVFIEKSEQHLPIDSRNSRA